MTLARRRVRRPKPVTGLLAGLLTGLVWAVAPASAAVAQPAARAAAVPAAAVDDLVTLALLGKRASAATPQPLTLTSAPRRAGQDVVLTAQVLGVPGQGTAPRAVAFGVDDGHGYAAAAQITRAADAPQRTAVLVVDTSGSMGRSGMDAARRAAQVYADTVGPSVRVGLVGFADHARVLAPPTTDRAALTAGIGKLVARGETALYDGLALGTAQAGPNGNVVVLSDGGDTTSRASLEQAVAAAAAGGVRVDVIAFKTAESASGPLRRIAAAGHGQVVQAADAAGLGRAFAVAAAAVPLDVTITVQTPQTRTSAQGVRVGLLVGGQAYVSAVELPAAPVTPGTTPMRVVHVPALPGWLNAWVIAGALFAFLVLTFAILAWPGNTAQTERRRREQALRAYGYDAGAPGPAAVTGLAAGPAAVSGAAAGVLQVSERVLAAGGRQGAIGLRLDRAGLTLLPHEWIVLRVSIAVTGAAGGFLVLHPRWLGLPLGTLLGWLSTGIWLRVKQSRRCRAFADQLPDTLQVMASSLRSGFSLPQSLAAAQAGGAQPMASELGRALAAARIGVVLEDELDQVARRMRSEDWRLAVMAIRIQRSVGGSLAEVLHTTSRTLRERAAVTRQVRALSAEGRLSAYVLLGLPVVVALFLLAFRRAYVEPLWTTAAGLVMLALAAVGMTVGTWWMLKAAKVEV